MEDAEHVAEALGDAEREGSSWRCRCPIHDGRSLVLSNAKDGKLLWHCHGGCGQDDIMQELIALGLYEQPRTFRPTPTYRPADHDEKDKIAYATKIWEQARRLKGTQGERYLRARGYRGPLKKSLRFHPDLWHAPSRSAFPALVAKVVRPDSDDLVGVHRTFLSLYHLPEKAPLGDRTKMALGVIKGAVVRLGTPRDRLLLAEGIETCLCASGLAGLPGWAALGAWNFENVVVPPHVEHVIIAADNDGDNKEQSMLQARLLRQRLLRRGLKCIIVPPPDPGTDWADVAARTVYGLRKG